MPSDVVPSSLRMPGMRCVWPSSAQQAACMSLLPLSYYRSCSSRGAKFASRFVTREAFKASRVTPVFRTEHFFASNGKRLGSFTCETAIFHTSLRTLHIISDRLHLPLSEARRLSTLTVRLGLQALQALVFVFCQASVCKVWQQGLLKTRLRSQDCQCRRP